MSATISLRGQSADLENLHDWLAGERELQGRVRPAAPQPAPGELGDLSNILLVTLGSGGAVSVLAASLRGWFAQPRRASVKIQLKTEKGETLTIDAKNVKDRSVETILNRALDGGPD
ncbi:effector-associated constant component EACC1 [Actinomadura violacea]|uniref:Uncharacterized protein n=1 Tax=Actinomadura violacea TaxID=2819934 RepID=A0ABS3RR40_9ACTN|nr:hypothetical protein [Actinomadura violacea]MBO2459111.1 hypothetical protein [Actinomadura violacea]